MHDIILRPHHSCSLSRILLIATNRKSVSQAWEILVVIRNAQRRNDPVRCCLQLLREHIIMLRCQYLHRHCDFLHLFRGEKSWVGWGDGIDEIRPLLSKAENSPAAVAVTRSANMVMLRAYVLGYGKDLWPSNVLAVSLQEAGDVEVLWVVQTLVGRNDLSTKAGIWSIIRFDVRSLTYTSGR